MPTNRPFFANFLAAFRAHSALTKASSSTATSNVNSQSPSAAVSSSSSSSSPSSAFTSPSTQITAPSSARTIATKSSSNPGPSPAAAAVQAANNAFSHTRHTSASPHNPSSSVGRHTTTAQSPNSPTRSGWAQRRGSDSSNDSAGFREVLGAEKWYIGGRTATGEERFLRLGMVHRERSWERRSADQLSL